MNKKRTIILALFVLVLVVGAVIFFTRIADYPAAQVVLAVRSGTAVITRAGGQQETIQAGNQAMLNNRDAVKTSGQGSLAFAGAQADLAPGTEMEIARYGAMGGEAQVELLLKAGQTWQRISGYQDGRSQYRLRTATSMVVSRGGEVMVNLAGDQSMQVGVLSGQAVVSAQNRSVTLDDGQGTDVVTGLPPADATAWSRVRVLTYRPDGSAITLPATLTNTTTGLQFQVESPNVYVVPAGTYNLSVEALEDYQVADLTLSPGTLNELPVTMSELIFTTVDTSNSPVSYTGLTVQGSSTARAVPDNALLISPGKWTVFAAREEKPSAIQSVDVELSPGQRKMVALRNDLFGGGTVQVHVTAMDGSTLPPVNVFVYSKGNEAGQPLLMFRSDGSPQPLPPGSYAVSVRTALAQRFEVTIVQSQNVPLNVQLGALTVTYTDTQGHTNPHSPLLYIASAPDMQRLGISVSQMRQTPYGMAIPCCQQVIVPAGIYNVTVDDVKDVSQQNVVVKAGKTTAVDLKAGQ